MIGTDTVEPVDVLAAADLRERLEGAYADQAAGVEARHAAAELESWQQSVSKSYAWQVAAILADFMGQARLEVTSLVDQIRAASIAESVDERLRRRQQAIALILKTFGWSLFVVLALLAGAAAIGWVSWSSAILCGGVLIAVYILVSLALFLVAQRDMFAEMNSRKSALSQLEAMQTNLRSALEDLSRLSMAYGQLLSWCRAMGAFLRAPFGLWSPPRRAPGLADPGAAPLDAGGGGGSRDPTKAIPQCTASNSGCTGSDGSPGRGSSCWRRRRPKCGPTRQACWGCPARAAARRWTDGRPSSRRAA